jgi:hypothetical protein
MPDPALMTFRSLLLPAFLTWTATGLHAQAPDVDAWMDRHFSGKPGAKPDPAADAALYAALGLDSLRTNRFIGQVEGEVRLADRSRPVAFLLWQDTLEAMLRFWSPGDTTTFAADLRTNTLTVVTTGTEGEPNAFIADLRERVVVNWYRYKDDGSPWRVYRKQPYESNTGILGRNMERSAVVLGDTVRFLRYERGPSPFLDALEWLPYGGDHPFNLFMQLARAGEPMPRMLRSRAGTVDVHERRMGPRPRPTYRMGDNVQDMRPSGHRPLPIRRRNTRVPGVVELDPIADLPEGTHGYTADPGRPDEPEVTYTGVRSRMRVHPKHGCGAAGTVVVKVWIDRKGLVQRAEMDAAKSTLRSDACLDTALEAAKQDTFYPMEGAMPVHEGEYVFEYRK